MSLLNYLPVSSATLALPVHRSNKREQTVVLSSRDNTRGLSVHWDNTRITLEQLHSCEQQSGTEQNREEQFRMRAEQSRIWEQCRAEQDRKDQSREEQKIESKKRKKSKEEIGTEQCRCGGRGVNGRFPKIDLLVIFYCSVQGSNLLLILNFYVPCS